MQPNIILAPSGSGKTHIVLSAEESGQPRWTIDVKPSDMPFGALIDGDDVVKQTIGWPQGQWWTKPNAGSIHASIEQALTIVSRTFNRCVILFNGQWSNATTISCAVVIPELEHAEHIAQRVDSGPTNQPTDWNGQIRKNRDDLKTWTKVNHIPLFGSLTTGIRFTRMRVAFNRRFL